MLAMNYCPSCTNEMQRITIAGIDLVQCAPCAGILVPWSGLEQLFASVPKSEVLIEHLEGLSSSDDVGPVRNHATCPCCRKVLSARRLGKSVAPFYYCDAHGAMFDVITLNRLLHGVLTGTAPLVGGKASSGSDSSIVDVGDVLELVVDALTGLLD